MRELLFRGKRADNGKWVMGHNIIVTNGGAGAAYIAQAGTELEMHIDSIGNMGQLNAEIPLIDRETVGEYTGMADKAGNRVFDGDILRFTESETETYNCVVEWVHGGWGIFECDGEKPTFDLLDAFFLRNAEVIGNKFDNPELLGVNQYGAN